MYCMKKEICIKTEYIKLGQLLKFSGVISNGSDCKAYLEETQVFVNGELEERRGRKIYPGYIVKTNDLEIIVKENVKN